MNFLNKYLKYKKRYLNLKNNMIGGVQMVFYKYNLPRICSRDELNIHKLSNEYPNINEYLDNKNNETNENIEDTYKIIEIPNLKTNCLKHYVRQRMFKICYKETNYSDRFDFLYSYNIVTCNLIVIYDNNGSFGMFHVDALNTYNDLVYFYNKFSSPKEIYLFTPDASLLKDETMTFVDNFFSEVKENNSDIIIHPKIIGITDGLDWDKKEIGEIKIVNENDNFDYKWPISSCYIIAKRNEIIITFGDYALELYEIEIEKFNRFLDFVK